MEESKVENAVETPTPVVIPDAVSDTPPVEVTSPEMVQQAAPAEPVQPEAPVAKPAEQAPEKEVAPSVEPPKKEKKKGPMVALCVVVVLLLLVGGGYFFLRSTHTGEKFLTGYMEKLEANVKEVLKEYKNIDLNTTDYRMNGNVKVSTSGEGLDYFNNINLTYDLGMSLKNDYMNASVKLTQDDVSTDAKMWLDANKAYADLGDLFTKKIFVESEENYFTEMKEDMKELTGESATNMADLEYLLEKGINYSKEALKESTITTNYDGLKATYTYVIDSSNKDKINKKFADLINADSKMKELTGESSVLVSEDAKVVVTVNFITNELENLEIVVGIDTIKLTKKEANKYLLEITSGSFTNTADVTVNGNEYTINVKDFGTIIVRAKGNDYSVSFNVKQDNVDATVKLDYSKKSDSKYSMALSVAAIMDESKINVDATMDAEFKEGLISKDVPADAVNVETLTPEEAQALETNFGERLSKYKFYQVLESLSGLLGGETEEDYPAEYEYEY